MVGGSEIGKLPVDGRNAGDPDTVTVTLPPDGPVTETTTVTYGTVEGAEQDWYLPFQTIVVEPCPPVDPPVEEEPPVEEPTDPVVEEKPEVRYENCDEVRAAGKAPILEGQPGFEAKLDRDADGVGCEVAADQVWNSKDGSDGATEAALADTGVGEYLPFLIGGGVVLLAGGGGLLVLARRRSARSDG